VPSAYLADSSLIHSTIILFFFITKSPFFDFSALLFRSILSEPLLGCSSDCSNVLGRGVCGGRGRGMDEGLAIAPGERPTR